MAKQKIEKQVQTIGTIPSHIHSTKGLLFQAASIFKALSQREWINSALKILVKADQNLMKISHNDKYELDCRFDQQITNKCFGSENVSGSVVFNIALKYLHKRTTMIKSESFQFPLLLFIIKILTALSSEYFVSKRTLGSTTVTDHSNPP